MGRCLCISRPRPHAAHASTRASPTARFAWQTKLFPPPRLSSYFPYYCSRAFLLLPKQTILTLWVRLPLCPVGAAGKQIFWPVMTIGIGHLRMLNLCPKAVLSPVQTEPKNSTEFETKLIDIVKSHAAIILSCNRARILITPDRHCCQKTLT